MPSPALHFRPAAEKDLQAVYDLYMDPAANPYLTYDPMDLESFRQIFSELLPTQTLFIAQTDDEIAGSYRLIQKPHRQAHTIYIGGFVVSSKSKGRGYGFQMMEHIINDAKRKGMKRLELTVDLKNQPAIRLYQKAGFEIEGVIRKSYRLSTSNEYYDEYLMALIL